MANEHKGILDGLTLEDRRRVWSEAQMESRGQDPTPELLKEIRASLDLEKKQQEERAKAMQQGAMHGANPPTYPPRPAQ